MNTAQDHYAYVLSLMQLHLLQEHPSGQWLESSAEVCDFFRQRLQPAVKTAAPKPAVAPAPNRTPITPKPAVITEKAEKREPSKPQPLPPSPPTTQVVASSPPAKPESPKQIFTLVPPAAKPKDSMDDWKRILADTAPNLPLLDQVPSEHQLIEQHLAQAKVWIALGVTPSPPDSLLLQDLVQALSLHGFPTCLIPQQKLNRNLPAPQLLLTYRTNLPSSTSLPPLSDLMDSPEQKAHLWKVLVDLLKS